MASELLGLSSMATKEILAALAEGIAQRSGERVRFRSDGGVEIARQVRAGVPGDLVVLADAAIESLAAEGHVLIRSIRPLFVSDTVAAVPAGVETPPIETEDGLRAALVAAGHIAYSTGPSGSAVLALIERWGLARRLADRLVRTPPGVSVGHLLSRGEADLGFQQRSELMNDVRVVILGPLPGGAAIRSTFSGAVLASSSCAAAGEEVLRRLASGAPAILAGGMSPATPSS